MRIEYVNPFGETKSFEIDNSQEAFTTAIRAAVAAKPEDYVYQSGIQNDNGRQACFYVHPYQQNNPCLIGDALMRLGVPEDYFYGSCNRYGARQIMMRFGFDAVTNLAAQAAQSVQDNGLTWPEALRSYEVAIFAGVDYA